MTIQIASASRPPGGGVQKRIRVDAERLFYVGEVGHATVRRMGALIVFVSLDAPISYRLGDEAWASADCLVIQPYALHRIACATGMLCDLLIEPESVAAERLPAFLRSASGGVHAPDFVRRMRSLARGGPLAEVDLDLALFDRPLAPRQLDRRIAMVARYLQGEPNSPCAAADFAAQLHLSPSRFLALFKQEIGVSYRTWRAWKRARMLMPFMDQPRNLTCLAQDFGYPDLSHFSNSIQQIYGMRPSLMFRGCRRLQFVAPRPQGRLATSP